MDDTKFNQIINLVFPCVLSFSLLFSFLCVVGLTPEIGSLEFEIFRYVYLAIASTITIVFVAKNVKGE